MVTNGKVWVKRKKKTHSPVAIQFCWTQLTPSCLDCTEKVAMHKKSDAIAQLNMLWSMQSTSEMIEKAGHQSASRSEEPLIRGGARWWLGVAMFTPCHCLATSTSRERFWYMWVSCHCHMDAVFLYLLILCMHSCVVSGCSLMYQFWCSFCGPLFCYLFFVLYKPDIFQYVNSDYSVTCWQYVNLSTRQIVSSLSCLLHPALLSVVTLYFRR